MKKIIITIIGIAVVPMFAFGQFGSSGNYESYSDQIYRRGIYRTYPSTRSSGVPYGHLPSYLPLSRENPKLVPAQKPQPQIADVTPMANCARTFYSQGLLPEPKDAVVDENGISYYYRCMRADGKVFNAVSKNAITIIEDAIATGKPHTLFYYLHGLDGVSRPVMSTIPPYKPSEKPTMQSPYTTQGPTDLGDLPPLPSEKPNKESPFEFVPIEKLPKYLFPQEDISSTFSPKAETDTKPATAKPNAPAKVIDPFVPRDKNRKLTDAEKKEFEKEKAELLKEKNALEEALRNKK